MRAGGLNLRQSERYHPRAVLRPRCRAVSGSVNPSRGRGIPKRVFLRVNVCETDASPLLAPAHVSYSSKMNFNRDCLLFSHMPSSLQASTRPPATPYCTHYMTCSCSLPPRATPSLTSTSARPGGARYTWNVCPTTPTATRDSASQIVVCSLLL